MQQQWTPRVKRLMMQSAAQHLWPLVSSSAICVVFRCCPACCCRYFNLSGAHALLATVNGPGVVAAFTLANMPPERGLRACANLAGLVPPGEDLVSDNVVISCGGWLISIA
jgi:hypothetical protein